jgi:hypothetical protein
MLSRDDLVMVASRCFAVALGLIAFQLGASIVAMRSDLGIERPLLWIAFGALPFFFAAVFLWKFPLAVGHGLLGPARAEQPSLSPAGVDALNLCFTVLGAILALAAFRDLLHQVVFAIAAARANVTWPGSETMIGPTLVLSVLELGLGLWLLLGARGWVRVLRRIRGEA